MATQNVAATISRPTTSNLARAGALALVLSLVANHLIRLVAVALLNPDPGFMALTQWAPVTLFTVVGVVGAVLVYWLISRVASQPKRVFTIVALVFLAISMIPDLMLALNPAASMLPGTTAANMLALAVMHLPPAYFCIRFLTQP